APQPRVLGPTSCHCCRGVVAQRPERRTPDRSEVTHDASDDNHAQPRTRTWDDVLDLWARGTRAPSDETVGRWALGVLQRELGDCWVADCEARGWLPPE